MTRTRTEITIETERVLVINQRRHSRSVWCEPCGRTLPMLSLDETVAITGVPAPTVFELAKTGRMHLTLSTEGELGVCPGSPALRSEEGNR